MQTSVLLPRFTATVLLVLFTGWSVQPVMAVGSPAMDVQKARVVEHWTPQRRAQAIPRDLVIDARGQAYLRKPDGSLEPYGRQVADQLSAVLSSPREIMPMARPTKSVGGGGASKDTIPPTITNMDPAEGSEIGSSYTFSATVTDASGIKSVSFVIQYPDGTSTQSFTASQDTGDIWSTTIQGFTDGQWSWWVVAKDNGAKGGNTATSPSVAFTVNTGGSSGGSSDTITNAEWSYGGAVQTAAGRLYFEMPTSSNRRRWSGYVCSGTAVTDDTSGRSIILTAAHCVYDDANQAFARNVLFIPDQADTSGTGTDLNCDNDPLGCWVPSFGAVDENWTTAVFPDNIPWDYAYYVVNDSGAHTGTTATSDSLETAAGALPVSFLPPYVDDGVPGAASIDFTYALGYSYSDDPNFMYCAEDMTTESSYNDWWLPSCGLSGGSSGGPWVQPMDITIGSGPVISVNSWGYTNTPGMAGPRLSGTSAECVFTMAKTTDWLAVPTTDGDAGTVVICP